MNAISKTFDLVGKSKVTLSAHQQHKKASLKQPVKAKTTDIKPLHNDLPAYDFVGVAG
jgi:hypothetical protein